ncbi:MAG: PTS sugar transporter subunit IIA [Bacteroidota bacterium]|jgi:fructose-specific phosphotransferase system IIA component
MKITEILKPSAILLKQEITSKEQVLDTMLNCLEKTGLLAKPDEARKAVLEREKIMSTGIGKGFALPHGKTNHINETVGAFLTLKHPIDFNSLDQEPVSIVFMLIGRENTVGTHLRLLSRISRLMNSDSFRENILQADTPEQIIEFFTKEEEDL